MLNPDIRVEDAPTLKETEPKESGCGEPERREVAEPKEEENTEPEEEGGDREIRRSIDGRTETSTETKERRDRSRHVPGVQRVIHFLRGLCMLYYSAAYSTLLTGLMYASLQYNV
ncbi:hypothetical protein NDU88_007108 [Pleurodeles waltl]|uniref:Uncharacterized protein n=1 Tax=Pleurodeles waltl TaxID=8319 RepID=A0AAV7LUG2_PLEWA|nr:hypothetical protein NDU88_007108 [Pleurodeles waltl]